MENQVFAVLGGDARHGRLASLLAEEGYTVFAAGFDTQPQLAAGAVQTNACTAAAMSGVVILPVMPTSDGATLTAPYAAEPIALDERLCESMRHARVFTGFAERISGISKSYAALDVRDYSHRETFLLKNAQITAEAALMLAVEQMPGALYESRCLITGYGRIGKALAPLLRATGAAVTVAARRPESFAAIEAAGFGRITYSRLALRAEEFDLVVNTADSLVLGETFIKALRPETVIIDLASHPGGTDFEAAKRCGIKTVHALGLPGRYAPATAARIIMDTVTEMMEEEHN